MSIGERIQEQEIDRLLQALRDNTLSDDEKLSVFRTVVDNGDLSVEVLMQWIIDNFKKSPLYGKN